jgi:hypothetical protein
MLSFAFIRLSLPQAGRSIRSHPRHVSGVILPRGVGHLAPLPPEKLKIVLRTAGRTGRHPEGGATTPLATASACLMAKPLRHCAIQGFQRHFQMRQRESPRVQQRLDGTQRLPDPRQHRFDARQTRVHAEQTRSRPGSGRWTRASIRHRSGRRCHGTVRRASSPASSSS